MANELNIKNGAIIEGTTSVNNFSYNPNNFSGTGFRGELLTTLPADLTGSLGKIFNMFDTGKSDMWAIANAGSDTTSTNMLGIAVFDDALDGVLIRGLYYDSSFSFSTLGAPLYLSTTDGEFTETPPNSTGDVVRIIGYYIGNDTIYFCPDNTWVEV